VDKRAELVRAIRVAKPGDLTPRRAYGEWLVKHGDAERGEWVRLACDYNSMPDDAERRALLKQWHDTFRRNKQRWWKRFHDMGLNIHAPHQYAVGLVESASISTTQLLEHGATLFAEEPIVSLWLSDTPSIEDERTLASWDVMRELHTVGVPYGNRPDACVALALAGDPERLAGIVLGGGIAVDGVQRLAASALRPEHFTIGAGSTANEEDVATLLASPFTERLDEVQATGDGWGTQLLAGLPRPLRKLTLWRCSVTTLALERVIDEHTTGLGLSGARRLDISRLLARAPMLTSLSLRDAQLTDTDLAAIIAAKPPLQSLAVSDNRQISDGAAVALANAFYGVELDLRGCGLGEEAIETLEHLPGPVRTRRVEDMPEGWYGKLP
jgi:uncharacterized protein (TIGR02996 family)